MKKKTHRSSPDGMSSFPSPSCCSSNCQQIHSFDSVPLPGPSASLRSLIAWLIPSACRRRHGYGPWSVSGPFGMATSRVYCQCSFASLTNPPPILPVFLQFFPNEYFFFLQSGPAALASDNAGAANIVYTRDATSSPPPLTYLLSFSPLLSVSGWLLFLSPFESVTVFLSFLLHPHPNLHSSQGVCWSSWSAPVPCRINPLHTPP